VWARRLAVDLVAIVLEKSDFFSIAMVVSPGKILSSS
jgi:hypothetical protein